MKLQKIAVSGDDAGIRLLAGVAKLAHVVGITYGPYGRVVLLEQPWAAPVPTRDGVTVTRAVELSDPLEALGAQLLRHAALRTADIAGDGTTTAVLLGHGLVAEATRRLAAGAHRAVLVEELAEAVEIAVTALEDQRLEPTPERLLRVGALAAREESVGATIVAAAAAAGAEGEVQIARGRARVTTTAVSDGHSFETAGYHGDLAPPADDAEPWANATVIGGEQFDDVAAIERLLVETMPRPLLLVGRIGEGVRQRLLSARLVGDRVVAAFPPGKGAGHGDALRLFFGDLATLTGGDRYRGRGEPLPGVAGVAFNRTRIALLRPGGDMTEVERLRARLHDELTREPSAHARAVCRHRLAFIAQPLIRVEVGADTVPEAEEAMQRHEDALGAVRGALTESVLPGGGAALRTAARSLPSTDGGQVLARALQYPIRRLLQNAGLEPAPVLAALEAAGPGYTWDLQRDRAVPAGELGVFDSAAAVRCALMHAADVAQSLILTDTVLAERDIFWR